MILLPGETGSNVFSAEITATGIRNAFLIAAGFAIVIALAEIWHRSKLKPRVEWTRKLVHLGGGAICLLIPLLISSFWIVLILAAGMCLLFIVTKRMKWLQSIHGIDRSSHGTEFYPVVILLLFVVSGDRYWQYVICVLVLAVSDSAAALIGTRYGKFRFTVEEEKKSVEGSLAFFFVTVLVVLVPLLTWNPLSGSGDAVNHYLLTATLLGLLVTCMEVVSLRGTDNLWVPLGTWLVLTKTFQTDVLDLAIQNVSFAAMLVCLIAVARTSDLLNVGGALVCCLAAYGLWAMGSLDWAMVFFIAFGFYLLVAWLANTPWQIRVEAAVYSLVPPVLCLAIANLMLNSDHPDGYRMMFGPFLAASCVSLGQATSNVAVWKHRKNRPRRLVVSMVTTLIVSLVVVTISMIRQGISISPGPILLCLVATLLVATSTTILPTLPPRDAPKRWLRIRSGFSTLAAIIWIVVQLFGPGTDWHPH